MPDGAANSAPGGQSTLAAFDFEPRSLRRTKSRLHLLACAVLTKPLSMTKPGYGKSPSEASALRPPICGRGPSGTVTLDVRRR
jgi:hypothetical protein